MHLYSVIFQFYKNSLFHQTCRNQKTFFDKNIRIALNLHAQMSTNVFIAPWQQVFSCEFFIVFHEKKNFDTFSLQSLNVIAKIKQQIRIVYKIFNDRSFREIEDRQTKIEFESWLKKMKWFTYLKKLNRSFLLNLIKTFIIDEKSMIFIVWNAMHDLLQHFQRTIQKTTRHYVRMTIVRNEIEKIVYRSLQVYMNFHFFRDYARSWQQIVVFFARIQIDDNQKIKKTSAYEFAEKKQKCFQIMMQQTRRRHDFQNLRNEQNSISNSMNNQNRNIDDRFDNSFSNQFSWILSKKLELSCLQFCFALFERRIRHHEYELFMICAMIVFVVKNQNWRISHDYSFFMFHIIKMIRFMIIQLKFQKCFFRSNFTTNESSSLMNHVIRTIERCMSRRCQKTMKWIFDRRTYDMKIHYISTFANHVKWMKDQIRYKNIEFFMNQLREMMHDLINQTYEILKVVMHVNTSKFFFISWLSLQNDFIRQNIEYNFTQNQRNKWSIETFTWLFDHLIDLRIFQHKNIMMNAHKIKKWFEKIDRFHELLIILMQ